MKAKHTKGPTNGQIVRYALSCLIANLSPEDIENMLEVPGLQYDSRAGSMVDDVHNRVRGWLESGGDSSADCWPAAPALLEACKIGLHWMECHDMATADQQVREDIALTRAAIRLAEGGGE